MPPSTKGLELLCRIKPLSDEEWLELVERRRQIITPYLDSFTLSTLGQVEFLHSEAGIHQIRHDSPECFGGQFDLKTQGIFNTTFMSRIQFPGSVLNDSGGVQYVWGLTRNGEWIMAGVTYNNVRGYKGRGYQRAIRVEIEKTTIPLILSVCKFTCEAVWLTLEHAVLSFEQNRKKLYEDASHLSRMCQIESLVLGLIPLKKS